MVKRGFTDKEKLTLYGLLRFPSLNDRELAEVLDENISTVTAIRRRLKKNGYTQLVNVPNFRFLDAEIITIGYGRISHVGGMDLRENVNMKTLLKDRTIFHSAFSKDYGFVMSYHKDYTDAKITMEKVEDFLNQNELFDGERWNFIIFPLGLSKILNNFNFSSLIMNKFDLEGIPFDIELDFEERKRENLTEKEKDVLKGLVDYPSLPDKSIAAKVNASRQAVSKIKKRFFRQNLLEQKNIIDLKKLDYEILVLAHTKFNPNAPLHQRKEGVKLMTNKMPQIFMVSGNYENILLGAFNNYNEFNEVRTQIMKLYKKQDFILDEPKIILFPMEDLEYCRRHDYQPVLEYLLNDEPP